MKLLKNIKFYRPEMTTKIKIRNLNFHSHCCVSHSSCLSEGITVTATTVRIADTEVTNT